MTTAKRKGKSLVRGEDSDAVTDMEYAVAKFLRFNGPLLDGNLCGMPVQTFLGSRAVDTLLDSNWATGAKGTEVLFTTRASATIFCNRLLQKGLFHRALKVLKKRREEGAREGGTTKPTDEEKKKKKKEEEEDEEKRVDREKRKKEKEERKKKRKVRLDMHEQQIFLDTAEDFYVWIYDPTSTKTFLIGLLVLVATIAACLFPMWPEELRLGAYYLSLGGIGFLGVFLALAAARYVIFAAVWLLTAGRHYFWLLPNLTEDVGFVESFIPAYTHTTSSPAVKLKTTDSPAEPEEISAPVEEVTAPAEVESRRGSEDKSSSGSDGGFEHISGSEADEAKKEQ